MGQALSTDERAAVASIRSRLPAEYKKASPHLLDEFGGYCAYCELPLDDPIQLEHAVPKSQYPTSALSWDNFLPACIGCNSRKNDQPLRSTVAASLPAAPPPTAQELHDSVRLMYRWPDLDAIQGFFTMRLFVQDSGSWTAIPNAAAVAPETVRVARASVVAGTVLADIPSLGLRAMPVAAIVCDESIGDPKTAAMIAMCQLARWPLPGDSADRRTLFRTEAWLRAVKHLAPLAGASPPMTLPEHIPALIQTGGFYWVWLAVASLISPGLGHSLATLTKQTLPGTDAGRLP